MILYITAALVAAGFMAAGSAKLVKAPAMVTRADHVGFNAKAYQLIGAAEIAGALGVLGGLWYIPLGYSAGAGLLLLMAGALVTHIRVGDKPTEMIPALAFAVVTATYVVSLGG